MANLHQEIWSVPVMEAESVGLRLSHNFNLRQVRSLLNLWLAISPPSAAVSFFKPEIIF
jgi:hypothetical protein